VSDPTNLRLESGRHFSNSDSYSASAKACSSAALCWRACNGCITARSTGDFFSPLRTTTADQTLVGAK